MLKGDLVNSAYEKLRISGLTSQPTPEDITLGLDELENMMAEMFDRNICVNYNFEDDPDINSLHNVERKYWSSLKCVLASRLLAEFNKIAPQSLINEVSRSWSYLFASTAKMRQVSYPSRMARGSGNTLRNSTRYRRYYNATDQAPISCETNTMFVGDIQNFTEHFDAYLDDGETVASYTLEAPSGLAITSQALASPDINYTVRADGTNEETGDNLLQIVIVATTSAGRKTTRIINFKLCPVPDV